MNEHEVIRSLLQTEKGRVLEPKRQYMFVVDRRSNKIQIRQAVEKIYQVKVDHVNTSVMPGKPRRVRRELGNQPDWKRAVVTLKEGSKIEVARA